MTLGQATLPWFVAANVVKTCRPQAQGVGGGQRDVALEADGSFQGLEARQAGRGRQMHATRELHVGQRAVALQLVQDAQIYRVKLHNRPDSWNKAACYAVKDAAGGFFSNSFRARPPTVCA